MITLIFATTNPIKLTTLEYHLTRLGVEVSVVGKKLELIEEQAADALQVAESKARQAYNILGMPVVVEDSACHITALQGFPGVYQKYVVETIGPEGIIKLMDGVEDRSAYFTSSLVYVDEHGNTHHFSDNHYAGTISDTYDPHTTYDWGALGKIFIPQGSELVAANLSQEERHNFQQAAGFTHAYEEFAKWYREHYA